MEVVLDLRSRHHGKAGLLKNVFNPEARARYRVHAAHLRTAARQGDINRPLGKFPLHGGLLETDAMHLKCGMDGRLGIIDALARSRAFGGRQRP
jgi:hypothetical protein